MVSKKAKISGINNLAKSELEGPLQNFAGKLQSIKIKAGQKYDARLIVKALHGFLTDLKTLPVGKKKIEGSILVTEQEKISLHNKILILYTEKNSALQKNYSAKLKKIQLPKKAKKKAWGGIFSWNKKV